VRVFEQAEFDFQPGMNLLAGINGAGKSTVLDVLRIMLSYNLPKLTASRSKPISFEKSDITVGSGALTAQLYFDVKGTSFEHLMHLPREEYIPDKKKEGQVRGQTIEQVERNELKPDGKDIPKKIRDHNAQSLAIFFSTRRSYPVDRKPTSQSIAGTFAAPFADALTHRELNIREFAEWWFVQKAFSEETGDEKDTHRLTAFENAVCNFLENCRNLRAVNEPKISLLIDKNGTTLDIRQLSDGERGMLALVLDIARRLAMTNPVLEEPLKDGKAVVLIDELDLHLHPRWQRTVVERLTRTFPNCQFIATTHSPQIVGEVPPEQIILIDKGKITRPNQSLGMDANWILRFLMGSSERDEETRQNLKEIEDLIETEQYEKATHKIKQLRSEIGDFPELVGLQTRIDVIDFLSDDETKE